MTKKETIYNALGMIEGAVCVSQKNTRDVLMKAIQMIKNSVEEETSCECNRDCEKTEAYEDLMEQEMLHEELNRLLRKYSKEHDGDKIAYGDYTNKWFIYFHYGDIKSPQATIWTTSTAVGLTFFYSQTIAEDAIEEVVRPFMKAHPNFKW